MAGRRVLIPFVIAVVFVAVVVTLLRSRPSLIDIASTRPRDNRVPDFSPPPDETRSELRATVEPSAAEDVVGAQKQPVESASLLGGFFVRTLDPDGLAVRGATVHLYTAGDSCKELGITGEDGVLELREGPPAGARLVAVRAGYASGWGVVHPPITKLVILLDHAFPIEGRVTIGGEPLRRAGLDVLAIPDYRLHPSASRIAGRDDPEFSGSSAVTDAEGRFRIESLSARRAYSVFAGGFGFYSARPAKQVRAGATKVEVPAVELFGAIFQLVDDRGDEVPKELLEWTHGSWKAEYGPDLIEVPPVARTLALSGLDPFLFEAGVAWDLRLLGSEVRREEPISIVLEGEVLGYEPFSTGTTMQRVETGIGRTQIVLRPITESRGSIHLRFVDARTGVPHPSELAPVPGVLRLVSRSDPAASRIIEETPFLLNGIPCGWYEVSYADAWGTWSWPATAAGAVPLHVSEGGVELAIPIDANGSIELDLIRPDRSTYEGTALVSVGRQLDEEAVRRMGVRAVPLGHAPNPGTAIVLSQRGDTLRGRPYRLNGLRAGEWTLLVASPPVVETGGSQSFSVTVEAGRTTRLEIVVREFAD